MSMPTDEETEEKANGTLSVFTCCNLIQKYLLFLEL
jgi:hypothetical protein